MMVLFSEQKPLFSVGNSVDNLDGEYKYTTYLSRYEFDNPLSPHADYFVYDNGRDLTIVNVSTATIAKSFPLTGMPIKFWWNDAGRDCVIGVEVSGKERDTWKKTYDYYLYQSGEGTLRKLSGTSPISSVEKVANLAASGQAVGSSLCWIPDTHTTRLGCSTRTLGVPYGWSVKSRKSKMGIRLH